MCEHYLMSPTRRANILSVLVFLMVLFVPIQFLFGEYSLYSPGKLSAISPLPIPFRDAGGFENYVYTHEIRLATPTKK